MAMALDERFPLSFYFRFANRLDKQAKVFREEGNLGDLFLTLNQYSRLMTEVIPLHRSYSEHPAKEKLCHQKILQEFTEELEQLKPVVVRHDDEAGEQVTKMLTPAKDIQMLASEKWTAKVRGIIGLVGRKVKDRSPSQSHRMNNTKLATDTAPDARTCFMTSQPASPLCSTATGDDFSKVHVVRHFFPSVVSCIEDPPVVGQVAHVASPPRENLYLDCSYQNASTSNTTHDVHISERLMEEFMGLAKQNTEKNLETCGIFGSFHKNGTYYVTTLIVPKQESTSNSCQASNEEEIHAILDEQSLLPAGWIHTHPSQTCFLSSIDLHTQYSYQVMLPEAIAIVMAPTDPNRNFGIFQLTDPGGIDVLRECKERGFHQHPGTADGRPIYESCSNIFFNPNLRFEIIDLRTHSP